MGSKHTAHNQKIGNLQDIFGMYKLGKGAIGIHYNTVYKNFCASHQIPYGTQQDAEQIIQTCLKDIDEATGNINNWPQI